MFSSLSCYHTLYSYICTCINAKIFSEKISSGVGCCWKLTNTKTTATLLPPELPDSSVQSVLKAILLYLPHSHLSMTEALFISIVMFHVSECVLSTLLEIKLSVRMCIESLAQFLCPSSSECKLCSQDTMICQGMFWMEAFKS